MNIVIIGAGDVGHHVASILSREENNVVLIDKDDSKLAEADRVMDVAIRQGSGTDWQLLDDLLDLSPELLLALTDNDEVNLVACSIAKNLGVPRTIARVKDSRYINRSRLDFARIFDVDHFISPELLAAENIAKYIASHGSHIESFAHGAVQLRSFVIPPKSKKIHNRLADLHLPQNKMMIALIKRYFDREDTQNGYRIIFPHGDDTIHPGDEVTFIGETAAIENIHEYFGVFQSHHPSIVIIGGSLTALNLAKILEKKQISVKIFDKDYKTCMMLAEHLPKATVVCHDATDIDFLRSEKIGERDVLVACTRYDELNFLAGVIGKQLKCEKVIISLSNLKLAEQAETFGITYTVSSRIASTDRILSLARGHKVMSMVSLFDQQAEVLEIAVSMDSKIVGIPLTELGPRMPNDFLIGMIQNRGRTMVASGNRIISPGDTVVVITHPKHRSQIEKLF